MEHLHSDVCGPVSVTTRDGKCYFISLVNDYSCYAMVYLLCKDVLQHFLWSAPLGRKCCFLHTDQGGEYKNDAVAKLLFEHGITHETMSSHMPEHNRVAKRFNCTIIDMVRCMLLNSSQPKNMWGEAIFLAVAINN
ncbi:integrase core domain containing protein [Acanthamoeba castellanii str. Neff]|uniref:Integrase core domain containing protein n=1 Tax=Acanthamoeba castellanii (strain ATCC 30010 / Neff) TaxID=1257118 RepID=L8H0M0_ACACF|nr:integrase core domain containing protein [Acanthamoeba castellanii str. Neff]ELR18785.1 integrase core domain containing protein [Acanthamoeba castellanii str. Neff]